MAVKPVDVSEGESLGQVQLRSESGEIILVPKPSSDPNDPLNWSQPFKYYVAVVTCFGMLMCTFLAAGPTVALVQIAMDFGGGPTANLALIIPQVAFFFTVSALTQGTGNLLWQPLINKYGKRPMYIISFSGYFATAIWSGISTSYSSELAARVLLGFFSGAGECLGPGTISDVFFLHERGSAMAMYNFATGSGVSIGIIVSGIITLNNSWRVIYFVGAAMIGVLLLLIIFTFPETAYNRVYDNTTEKGDIYENKKNPYRLSLSIILDDDEKAQVARYYAEADEQFEGKEAEPSVIERMEERIRRLEAVVFGNAKYSPLPGIAARKEKSYWSRLALFSEETFTRESLWKMFIRPFGLIMLPPVIWAMLVMSVIIGFNVAISSSCEHSSPATLSPSKIHADVIKVANDLEQAYGFTSFQSGLCFIGSLVGGILGIPAGGPVGEAVANYFTIRNNGIREPEFRLPAIAISVVTAPLSLVLYGVGIQYKLSPAVPIFGLSLLSFSSGQAINISFVYTLDAYSPVSGEVTIAQLAFKSIIGFGLSAATNIWIANSGLVLAFSEMAAITLFVLLLAIPLFFYGKRLRRWSLGWRAVTFVGSLGIDLANFCHDEAQNLHDGRMMLGAGLVGEDMIKLAKAVFLVLLERFRHCLATDERDKVFALLGLASSSSVRGNVKVIADYSKSAVDIFTSLTRQYINRQKNLDILCHAVLNSLSFAPSWVPCWFYYESGLSVLPKRRRMLGTDHGPLYRCVGDLTLDTELLFASRLDSNGLWLTGFWFDVLSIVGGSTTKSQDLGLELPSDSKADLIEEWKEMSEICSCNYGPKTEYSFRRTLVADAIGEERLPNSVNFGAVPKDEDALKIGSRGGGFDSSASHLAGYVAPIDNGSNLSVPGQLENWATLDEASIKRASVKRTFIVTEKCYMGLGPLALEEGNLVYVLVGGQVPFTLRPTIVPGGYFLTNSALLSLFRTFE
ncbi:hypothetical protein G7Y89_g8627 [Cudoniella acicularis]|uniref:Major facilitator superfamily (MFS) profile domain-containing protein n=1 Tax=Cudoniella acicularis TaxID=354080 RepID=A0A8H4W2P8_9HELO|nr:hypothetical protein G7Y89_g8627 [Cudoniella acicularis]